MKYSFNLHLALTIFMALCLSQTQAMAKTRSSIPADTSGTLDCTLFLYGPTPSTVEKWITFDYKVNGIGASNPTSIKVAIFPLIGLGQFSNCKALAQQFCTRTHWLVNAGFSYYGAVQFPFDIIVRANTAGVGIPNSTFTSTCL